MPSPVAHAAMGYAIYRLQVTHTPEKKRPQIGPFPRLLLVAWGLAMLPDLDFVPGFFFPGAFDQFHNSVTNSFITGVGVAFLVGAGVWSRRRADFRFWFFFTLACYEMHVLMDLFTVGRGAMLLWPLTPQRFVPPFKLFYGLHRSDGWLSVRHIWTLLTELGFAVFVGLVTRVIVQNSSKNETV